MVTLNPKGIALSYVGIIALVIMFSIGTYNCELKGIESFFYNFPVFVFCMVHSVFYS